MFISIFGHPKFDGHKWKLAGLAIVQIAQFGLSSLKGGYYLAKLFSFLLNGLKYSAYNESLAL
ncbi:hypothetical protein C9426_09805 [Serratia sp. S1B]|nr:hypothetical protein C9426_09805 [Serratia sp. S1B]